MLEAIAHVALTLSAAMSQIPASSEHGQLIGVPLLGGSRITITCENYKFERLSGINRFGSPGFLIQCSRKKTPIRKLVIWYHGGPWASAKPDISLEQLAFLDTGYEIFVPFYPGSSDRPTKISFDRVRPDAADALSEAKTIYHRSLQNYDRVDVLGESFGAYLATSLHGVIQDFGGVLYLFNPSLGGETRLAEVYAKEIGRLRVNSAEGQTALQQAKSINQKYFSRVASYRPLQAIQASKGLRLRLVYGTRDEKIELEEIATLINAADKKCGVDVRQDSGHEDGFTLSHFEGIKRLIRCEGVS